MHDLLVDVNILDPIAGVAGEFGDGTSAKVLDFDLGDHLSHRGFVEKDVDDAVEVSFVDEVIPGPQFGNVNHKMLLIAVTCFSLAQSSLYVDLRFLGTIFAHRRAINGPSTPSKGGDIRYGDIKFFKMGRRVIKRIDSDPNGFGCPSLTLQIRVENPCVLS